MSKSIWKVPLEVTDEQEIALPRGARILCVQVQMGVACLWAHVNVNAPKVTRRIVIVGTGNAAPDSAAGYIGTFQLHGVWHVFENQS